MYRQLQRLGRALMNPVAVLPVAGLLMGIGYWISGNTASGVPDWGASSPLAAFLIKAGAAVIDNLPLLFAVGVAFGLSKDNDGMAAISGLVAYLTITTLLSPGAVSQITSTPIEEVNVGFGKIANAFTGILSGAVAAFAYNRFYKTQLPDWFAFFSGRRLAPIMTSIFMLVVSGIMLFVWPVLYSGLVAFGTGISDMGAVGAGIYGFFNRLLIPTGLHHALNSIFWFDAIGIADINKFWGTVEGGVKGITGMYQAGFFPVMMFGLPAAALAMYKNALPQFKNGAKGLLLAAAFTSFFTGVTEPLEFAFVFLAPQLYLVHALLTGISVWFAAMMGWTAGFTFSAGLVDYVLSLRMPLANQPIMLLLQGLVVAALYFVIFNFAIKAFDIKTPGRIATDDFSQEDAGADIAGDNFKGLATSLIAGLGGKDNIDTVNYCATRLRVDVKDNLLVDEKALKATGVAGVVRPGKKNVQVIIGPKVQFVADEVKDQIK